MAEPEGTEFQRKAAFTFFTLLLTGGIALYWIWGLLYNTWYPFNQDNIAIYTICAPLVAFGAIGMLLYKRKAQPVQ